MEINSSVYAVPSTSTSSSSKAAAQPQSPPQESNSQPAHGIKLDGARTIPLRQMVENAPVETFDLGGGLYIEKQGPKFQLKGEGAEDFSIRDIIRLYEMRHMGADALAMSEMRRDGDVAPLSSPDADNGETMLNGTEDSDIINAARNTDADGGNGNDYLSIRNATGHGGSGHDYIEGSGTLYGDAGRDAIMADAWSHIDGGADDDYLKLNGGGKAFGGDGNDRIETGNYAEITGGTGDDDIIAGRSTTIYYNRGDGHDTITTRQGENDYAIRAAPFLQDISPGWKDVGEILEGTQVVLSGDIARDDIRFEKDGNNLIVSFQGSETDTMTIEKIDINGIPDFATGDGQIISGRDLRYAMQYQPLDLTV